MQGIARILVVVLAATTLMVCACAHTVLCMSSIELSGTAMHYLAEWEWEGVRVGDTERK